MKYYFDKKGRYVGMSNCGIEPEGATGCTSMAPEHPGQVFNAEKDAWETPGRVAGPVNQCAGTTKAGTLCMHKATHGDYCRQHVPT